MSNAKPAYYGLLTIFATVGTVIAEALGGWDTSLKVLVALMAIDYLTGILCALVWKRSPKSPDGTFESKASLKGLIRKGAVLLVVYIATRLDELSGTTYTRTATILFFIANDGLSIVENMGIMGVPLPEAVKNAFALLKKQGAENKETAAAPLSGYLTPEQLAGVAESELAALAKDLGAAVPIDATRDELVAIICGIKMSISETPDDA